MPQMLRLSGGFEVRIGLEQLPLDLKPEPKP